MFLLNVRCLVTELSLIKKTQSFNLAFPSFIHRIIRQHQLQYVGVLVQAVTNGSGEITCTIVLSLDITAGFVISGNIQMYFTIIFLSTWIRSCYINTTISLQTIFKLLFSNEISNRGKLIFLLGYRIETIGIVIVSLIAVFSSLILIAMCIFSILALLAGYGYFILPESDFGRDLIGTIIGFHWCDKSNSFFLKSSNFWNWKIKGSNSYSCSIYTNDSS